MVFPLITGAIMNSVNPLHVLILALIIPAGSAIKCYNCSSYTDPNCADPFNSEKNSLIECPQPESFCRKTVQILSDPETTRVTRACAWIKFEQHSDDYCMTSNTNFKKEKSCQCFADGCNAAVSIKSGVLFSIVFAGISLSAR